MRPAAGQKEFQKSVWVYAGKELSVEALMCILYTDVRNTKITLTHACINMVRNMYIQ